MTKRTLQQALVAALESLGERRVTAATAKYVVLTRAGTDYLYFVGAAGALRTGKTVNGSIPVSDLRRRKLIEVGKSLP